MLPRARLTVALLIGVTLLCCSSSVRAHQLSPAHSARVQVISAEDGSWLVHAALLMQLPPNERSRRLIAQFDLNKTGSIEAAEGRLLADALGPEAIGGFVLLADDGAPIPELVEGAATADGEGRIRVALLLSYVIPETVERLRFRVLETPGGGRVEARPVLLSVELRGADGAQPVLSPTTVRPGGPDSEVTLSDLRSGSSSSSGQGEETRSEE